MNMYHTFNFTVSVDIVKRAHWEFVVTLSKLLKKIIFNNYNNVVDELKVILQRRGLSVTAHVFRGF